MTPSKWAALNRTYPPTTDRPGPRDPNYTPYVVPFTDAIEDRREVIAFVCGSQMGKTDALLDLIGWRLDSRPRPLLFVGPSKDSILDQFEPRVMGLLNDAPGLSQKLTRGKHNRPTRKIVGGVPLRLILAGSEIQLSADQAGDVYVDELDRMAADVGGGGDPLTLATARSFTYRDRKIFVTSTRKKGALEVNCLAWNFGALPIR